MYKKAFARKANNLSRRQASDKRFKDSVKDGYIEAPVKEVEVRRIHKGKSTPKLVAKGSQSKATPVTSWGGVAEWYDSHLANDTYHEKVIMPRLFRMLGEIERKDILDLACGQGHVSRVLMKGGARVTGVDISSELITLAKAENDREKFKDGKLQSITYFASPSHKLEMLKDESVDIIICVLAIQNIEKVSETFAECSRVLRKEGRLFIVMNHPSYRIPQGSGWGFDEAQSVQYRRVDQYLSEAKIKIDMTPGKTTGKEYTISFHRPLQYYSKFLEKSQFAISRIEEWESHKKSGKGPRQHAEDTARKEIPLFMAIEAVKRISSY
jgi:ubiquinone/menaquinone biosynthesis C-methylase UbiE